MSNFLRKEAGKRKGTGRKGKRRERNNGGGGGRKERKDRRRERKGHRMGWYIGKEEENVKEKTTGPNLLLGRKTLF